VAVAGLLNGVYRKEAQGVDGHLVNVGVGHVPLLE
jgi:hypothetical protein